MHRLNFRYDRGVCLNAAAHIMTNRLKLNSKPGLFLICCLFTIAVYLTFNHSNSQSETKSFDDRMPVVGISSGSEKLYKCGDSRPLPVKKVAIISATTPSVSNARCIRGNEGCSYAFYLPLTALAWRRLNYSTAVIIAGDDKPWLKDGHYLNFVYLTLKKLGFVTVVFLPTSNELKVGIAQVGRVFVPDMEPFSRDDPDTYMVTSDADLFPITNIYDLQSEKEDIRFTNGHCCDPFDHKGESIHMVALSSVGMRLSTWHTVMKYRQISNHTSPVERIKSALMQEFGHLPVDAHRGPYNEWFFDQQITSIHLQHWFKASGTQCRSSDFQGERDRIDRIGWPSGYSEAQWFRAHDAHLPLPGHIKEHFIGLYPLAQLIAGVELDVAAYWHKYVTLMGADVGSIDSIRKELEMKTKQGMSGGYFHKPQLDIDMTDDDPIVKSENGNNENQSETRKQPKTPQMLLNAVRPMNGVGIAAAPHLLQAFANQAATRQSKNQGKR